MSRYLANFKKQFKFKYVVNWLLIAAALVVLIILSEAGALNRSTTGLLSKIAYSIILATSLNLVVGFLGELSLGHAGFACLGAYIGTFRAFFMPYESDGYYAFTTKFVYQENGEEDTEIQDFPAGSFEGDNDYTDETTGIGTIHTIDSDGTHRYYDMQGRQLRQRPAKGLYIEDGKIQFSK